MKTLCAVMTLGLCLVGPASAQYYGGRDSGYGDREQGYRERDGGYRERGGGYRDRDGGFDESEYLRCNPDVRRAVNRGTMESGFVHYQTFGRRERRRLSC